MSTTIQTAVTQQLDDLIVIANRRMSEHIGIMLAALKQISDIDPPGGECRFGCKCIGCIARRAIAEANQ